MRIDSHQHFWCPARGDYGWLLPANETLYRDFLPADLAPLLDATGIRATILVQAAASEAETRFLLDVARDAGFVGGVVGWLDLHDERFPQRAAALIREGKGLLKGLRPMLQDLAADDWIADPALDSAFDAMIRLGLTFDALVRPRHLPHLAVRIRRSPGLRVVIDHAAKPDIAGRAYDRWFEALAPLADMPGVHCKLSGLVTEAGPGWRTEDILPYASAVLGLFGPERTLWGSDWPVLNLNGDYRGWLSASQNMLAGLSPPDRELVLGGNAARFYSLDEVAGT